jgi:CRP-like cAMP-binding protein
LSGVAGASQTSIGGRRILRAGEFFGEVALAMHVSRTATVIAMTPCVVASCDATTFDELVRPFFADDSGPRSEL